MSKITPKREKFCQEYVISGNATYAYKKAYSTKNMKPKTINDEAYNLLKNPVISQRIRALQHPIAKKYEITREFIAENMLSVLKDAELALNQTPKKWSDPQLALKTTKALSKLYGLNVEKPGVGVNLLIPSDTPTDQIKSRVSEILSAVIKSTEK